MNEQLQESFKNIFGESPRKGDLEAFYRVRDALKIKNDDALWSVLFALQYYLTLYEKIPADIEARAKQIQAALSDTSKAIAEASMAQAHEKLSIAVANASVKVAEDVAGKQRALASTQLLQWAVVGALLLFVGAGFLAYIVHKSGYAEGRASGYEEAKKIESEEGYKRGRAEGYRETVNEKAAASWANTAEGKSAAEIARTGVLTMLTRCTAKGWKTKDGFCYPFVDERGQVHGWRLPSNERPGELARGKETSR
jgi:hypothetical protein